MLQNETLVRGTSTNQSPALATLVVLNATVAILTSAPTVTIFCDICTHLRKKAKQRTRQLWHLGK